VNAIVGGSGQTVNLSFNSSDGKAVTNLRVTTDLKALPSGWSAPAGGFSCDSVATGNGCVLALTYAPTTAANGTLTVQYSYTENSGAAKTGSKSISYASTAHDNLIGTV
jgi:hypothetical protein